MTTHTVGSLFSGVGGFEMGFEQAGWTIKFQVEIDPHCQKILNRHWPDVPKWGDVSEVNGADLPPVDCIIAGFPCQPFSVAGGRQGVGDEKGRGTLFWEIMRLANELRPKYIILENVPGLLSIDGGKTLRNMLDLIVESGYLVDVDILNAEHFGVPQSRRRVIIECLRADFGLNGKTTTSVLLTLDLLMQILGLHLAEAHKQSTSDATNSDLLDADYADGLRKRMRLLSPTLNPDLLSKLLEKCDDMLVTSSLGQKRSEPDSVKQGTRTTAATGLLGDKTEDELWNIAPLWKNISVVLCDAAKLSTTSTKINAITPQIIFFFARIALHTCERICRLTQSPPNWWHVVSSSSTTLEGFINYARQASSELFGDVDRADDWYAFLQQAEDCLVAIGHIGNVGGPSAKVPPVCEILPRDSAQGARKREEIAAGIGAGIRGENNRIVGALCVSDHKGVGNQYISDGKVVVQGMIARRLTPIECERLMGWPDDHTRWNADGTEQADTHRYKQCGNGVATPVAKWIAEHMKAVDA